ncbi:uncharacterized protein PAC_18762 [Phialocephala subalpina]|uniref:Peptidase C15, pyroglutamyl peptidase I-like protein n=1 Tax=Phialocephala subalpina TaxID=576137 RepID=A0A1L7XUZ2_9HELO|nr:uncharacterized protein PAC_18762 [Phialocephala subalpina]
MITEKGWDTVYPARRVKAQRWPRRVTTMASFDDKADWDEDNERRSAAKWKQPSSPYDGSTPKKHGIRIIVHPEPLKAEYHALLETQKLLEEYQPDMVIHLGFAADRDYFAIEKGAERDGYHQIPDERRIFFTSAETRKVWGKGPAAPDYTLDIENILRKWKANLNSGAGRSKGKDKGATVDIRTSDDVGNYVCGIVYFVSLEWFWKKFGPLGERRVLFFHVPNMQRNEDYEKGRILRSL